MKSSFEINEPGKTNESTITVLSTPNGLRNFGNTCFMNSVFQAISCIGVNYETNSSNKAIIYTNHHNEIDDHNGTDTNYVTPFKTDIGIDQKGCYLGKREQEIYGYGQEDVTEPTSSRCVRSHENKNTVACNIAGESSFKSLSIKDIRDNNDDEQDTMKVNVPVGYQDQAERDEEDDTCMVFENNSKSDDDDHDIGKDGVHADTEDNNDDEKHDKVEVNVKKFYQENVTENNESKSLGDETCTNKKPNNQTSRDLLQRKRFFSQRRRNIRRTRSN